MGHALTWPILAGVVIGGTGLGIHLGRSALSEIDPVHYSTEAPTRFHADLVANPPRFDTASVEFVEGEQSVTRDSYCPGCRMPDELDVEIAYGPSDFYEYDEPSAYETAVAHDGAEAAPVNADRATIETYASYPLTEEERAARKAVAENPAPPQPATGSGCSDISSVEEGCPAFSAS